MLLLIAGNRIHAMENAVARFLNRTSNKLSDSSETSYIVIYGAPENTWKINCYANNTDINCMVGSEKLRVYISRGTEVNEL